MKTLNELRDQIHENAKNKGFYDRAVDTPRSLMLIVSELSEAMEADRKGRYAKLAPLIEKGKTESDNIEKMDYFFRQYVKDSFEDELADSIIRILDLCGALDIDIEKHVELKMKYNATRERLHGKKY